MIQSSKDFEEGHKLVNWPTNPLSERAKVFPLKEDDGKETDGTTSYFLTNCEGGDFVLTLFVSDDTIL